MKKNIDAQDINWDELEELLRMRDRLKPMDFPVGCLHPGLAPPKFDPVAAANMDEYEVRKAFPRGHGFCGDCGSNVIMYASAEHYILGDW